MGSDIFESFRRYQTRLIREYNRLAREFQFTSVDARHPVEQIQGLLRQHISSYLDRSKRPHLPPVTPVERKVVDG